MSQKISHSGIIESVAGDCVKVRILQTSACAACKAAGHCTAAESKEKLVDVFGCATANYKPGQEVTVWASRDVANKALQLGFVFPFILLVGVLVAVLYFTGNEALAALSALGSLVPYYFLLWLRRGSLREQISFHIE